MMFLIFGGLFANFILGIIVACVVEEQGKFTDFEKKCEGVFLFFGLAYWILRLVTSPLFITLTRKKKKQEEIKKTQDKIIKQINNYNYSYNHHFNISNIQSKIEELKKSESQDLYSRAYDSFNDMLRILIKCSDGEGNLEENRFRVVIEEATKEFKETVEIAYKEYTDRLEKAKNQYYNSREEEINKDLQNMKNKNRDFREMWRRDE